MTQLFNIRLLIFIACAIIVPFTGCVNKDSKQNKQEQAKESFRCPIKCTEEKFVKPGHCPVCNMELVEENAG